eukprot:scaffold196168_cov38-Tisochrysis_lutea.AAC.3
MGAVVARSGASSVHDEQEALLHISAAIGREGRFLGDLRLREALAANPSVGTPRRLSATPPQLERLPHA